MDWKSKVTFHFCDPCYDNVDVPDGYEEMRDTVLATIHHGAVQHNDLIVEWRTINGVDGLFSDIDGGYFFPVTDLDPAPTPGQTVEEYLDEHYNWY